MFGYIEEFLQNKCLLQLSFMVGALLYRALNYKIFSRRRNRLNKNVFHQPDFLSFLK